MRKQSSLFLIIVLTLSLSFSVGLVTDASLDSRHQMLEDAALVPDVQGYNGVSYDPVDYRQTPYTNTTQFIDANTNVGFDTVNSTWNFPGDGTAGNPFIISGYNFTISGNEGIYLSATSYYIIIENNLFCFMNNNDQSIYLINADNIVIRNNLMMGGYDGIYAQSTDNVNITNNFIWQPNGYGISLYYNTNMRVHSNIIINPRYEGIYAYGGSTADRFDLIGNHIYGPGFGEYGSNYRGIYVNNHYRFNVSSNILTGGFNAMYIYSGTSTDFDSMIVNNTITGVESGIYLSSVYGGIISNNYIDSSKNDFFAIYLGGSGNNTITNNIMFGGGIEYGVSYNPTSINQFDTSGNTINGIPFLQIQNQAEFSLNGGSYGQIVVSNVTDVTISNLNLNHIATGIGVFGCGFVTITDNVITNVGTYGIQAMFNINSTLIANNTIMNAEGGIDVEYSVFTTIEGNKVVNTGINGAINLYEATNTTIRDNHLSYGQYGIYAYTMADLIVAENYLYHFYYQAIYIEYTSYAMVCDNLIKGAQYGIEFYYTDHIEVENNVVSMTSYSALYIYESSDFEVFDNTFVGEGGSSTYVTVSLVGISNINFFNNFVISKNKGNSFYISEMDYDVDAYSGGGCCAGFTLDAYSDFYYQVYANVFYAVNAIGPIVYSKNGITTFSGNYYSNYDNSGSYIIGGTNEVDASPSATAMNTIPNVVITPSIEVLEYTVGSTGNTISWSIDTTYGISYMLYMDNKLYEEGWTRDAITIDVDELAIGAYSYTLVSEDYYGTEIAVTITVVVSTVVSQDTITVTDFVSGGVTETNTVTVTVIESGNSTDTGDSSDSIDTPVSVASIVFGLTVVTALIPLLRRKKE